MGNIAAAEQANEQAQTFMPPLCTIARFAELTGLGERVVREQVAKGYYPVRKIGKYALINLAAIQADCLNRETGR